MMFSILRVFAVASLVILSAGAGQGRGEPPDYSRLLPRIPALSPEESLKTIQRKPGYEIELAAAEPNVFDPVAIAFDESARMFVIEMCDYSEQATERLGHVRMLEDKNNDGFYETSSLYADNLSWPTAIACYDGGLFVGAAPDILYIKDVNGDGKSDIRRVVFTGFGRNNVQGLLNSFCWGLDNRLYGQTSSSGGTISCPDHPNLAPVNLGGRDFSFDPRKLDLRPEGGGGQHGMSFDDWGNRFTCHNSDNLQFQLYDYRYQTERNLLPLPPSRQSIAVDGPQAPVYRISEVEPWRILRTNLRVTKQVAGLVEGGGRPSGYFTSATGVTIYRGDNMPDLLGMAIIGDVGSNIVHRKRLSQTGVTWQGERIDPESEFLASTDIWFRPVQFANGPDGCLYVLDLHREVIEHPLSLPQEIKMHLDLTSGRDRGRIYRVRKAGSDVRRNNSLKGLPPKELVNLLTHPNSWHRETASRLLCEQLGPTEPNSHQAERTETLEKLAKQDRSRAGGLPCLSLLVHLGFAPNHTSIWLAHREPQVRRAAIRLLEPLAVTDARLRSAIYQLAKDPEPSVRFQLALTLGILPQDDADRNLRREAVQALLKAEATDPALIAAIGNAAVPHLAYLLSSIEEQTRAGEGRGGWPRSSLALVGKCIALSGKDDLLAKLDRTKSAPSKSATKDDLMDGVFQGLALRYKHDAKKLESFPSIRKELERRIDQAQVVASTESANESERVAAIGVLRWKPTADTLAKLTALLSPNQPTSVQSATVDAISEYESVEAAEELIERYRSFSPFVRGRVADLLMRRRSWLDVLMTGAGEGRFDLSELAPAQQSALQSHADKSVQEKANKILGLRNSNRQELLQSYQPALTLQGDIEKGRGLFLKSCSACHRLESVGFELGPNLATFKYRGPAAILENVLDPNKEVNPQYINYAIVTKDEQTYTGMIESESATSITLTRGDKLRDTVMRTDIEQMKSSKASIMPEGLEKQLDHQAMADLIAYLLHVP
jgi:putative membrane-bound dehydrogenase-like protein